MKEMAVNRVLRLALSFRPDGVSIAQSTQPRKCLTEINSNRVSNRESAGSRSTRQMVAPLARLIYGFGEPGCSAHQRMKVALWLLGTSQARSSVLYLAYTIPHEKLEIPDLGRYTAESWTDTEKTYAAMVSRLDRDVGQVLDLLHDLNLDRRTVVFFTSDNGAPDRSAPRFFQSNAFSAATRGTCTKAGFGFR